MVTDILYRGCASKLRVRRPAFLVLSLLSALPAYGAAQDGQPFVAACTPPFTAEQHPIDNDCGIEGAGTSAAKRLESRTKNNFCATGAPVRLTFFSFDRLHAATRASDFVLGDNREGVRGDVHTHIAPTPSKAKANFCRAVIAEMSPHLRPDSWTGGDLMLADDIPIRLTGQLFYDGSHPDKSCPASASQKARARGSAWEIHPVYRVDVCRFTTLETCDPRDETRWQPLEEWLSERADEDHEE